MFKRWYAVEWLNRHNLGYKNIFEQDEPQKISTITALLDIIPHLAANKNIFLMIVRDLFKQ